MESEKEKKDKKLKRSKINEENNQKITNWLLPKTPKKKLEREEGEKRE